ncbi:MAG TPA: hypothetical protein ENI64_11325 [Gammaproteobacteria bacterium]|nr:hypothetical protein [Gammaproteobacteria bacterium]
MLMDSRLEIGSAGWQYPSWSENFYDEELPPEWRLTFYSNEFRFCVIPWSDWGSASQETLEQWADDIEPPFRFFLQIPMEQVAQISKLPDVLQQHVEGLVISSNHKLTHIPDNLQSLAQQYSLHLDMPVDTTVAFPQNILPCWRNTQPDNHDYQIAIIHDPKVATHLRDLRAQIETFLARQPHNATQYLVFDYIGLSIETMRNAMTIASMLPG